MYSSNIAPPMKLSSDLHHFNYHPNAFNAHTTAKINNHNACATGNAAYQLPPSDNIIVRPSAADDGARKQRKHSSSTIFDDTNICSARNKFSHGAYDSTFSHNIFDNNPKPRSQLNERILPRGPYLQYKLSENDNKIKCHDNVTTSKRSNVNVEALKMNFTDRGVLPRARITSESVLDASAVDYNLRTQTIGRYRNRPAQPKMCTQLNKLSQCSSNVNLSSHGGASAGVEQRQTKKSDAFTSHTLPIMRREHQRATRENFSHRMGCNLNYITLESALNCRTIHQLTPTQGWALLCQSVQALQDLFLSETPSISHILPVVCPSNFLVTSRGRVVYGLLTIDRCNEHIKEYLSEEYQRMISQRNVKFNESEVEKMWIYSLGRTLMKTMPAVLPPDENGRSMQQQHHSSIVLQATIWKMCKGVDERASLMFLLNIISDYCKNVPQIKPFSHIMIDMFKRCIQDPNFGKVVDPRNEQHLAVKANNEDHRSDTDSGRSSDYKSDDNSLKKKLAETEPFDPTKFFSLPRPKYSRIQEDVAIEQFELPKVKLRDNAENFRQRRVGGRRNTVDVSASDVENALGIRKALSRSASALHRPTNSSDEIRFKPRMNTKTMEDDDDARVRGPEFIINSRDKPKIVDISDPKHTSKSIVSVLLLNGKSYNLVCNALSTNAKTVFESIIKCEQIAENYVLGLCALIGGDFVFLPPDLKIYKVAPQVWIQSTSKKIADEIKSPVFTLYMRVKMFLPTLRVITMETRHTLYLQLRKSILENHIVCTDDDLITLGGLALQAEIGDFKDEMKQSEYFTISHYLPDGVYQQNKELATYLRNSHFSKRGLHSKEAEQNFIRYVQEMSEYGIHYISGIWTRDDKIELSVYIGIGLNGIKIFERNVQNGNANRTKNPKKCNKRMLYDEFDWLEIENICFSKQILCIVVRKSNAKLNLGSKEKSRLKFKVKMDSRKSFFAFTIASDHHQFYMKFRNSFASIKSIADEMNIPLTQENFVAQNLLKIDKPIKTGLRVRNLKKSMLNDNRLLKLRDRFIKRSKSNVGEFKRTFEENCNENNINKENERPFFPSMMDLSVKSPTLTRNKVKMGTRVFSASYLNKSFDSLNENQSELSRTDSWGALCIKTPDTLSNHVFNEQDEDEEMSCVVKTEDTDEKHAEFCTDRDDEAYVLHTSVRSINNMNNISLPNESMSPSLLEKFDDMSCADDDRVLSQITIVKDPVFSDKVNFKSQSLRNLSTLDNFITGYTMGISIVQGESDSHVYVKELAKSGPGRRMGVCVGDQIVAVDGISLLNLPYEEALSLLQKTGNSVTLIVSRLFSRKPMVDRHFTDDDKLAMEMNATPVKKASVNNLIATPSKSLPNLLDSNDYYQLPKIVAIISKENVETTSNDGKRTRRYGGPRKFPVTPGKSKQKDLKISFTSMQPKAQLSLPTNETDTTLII